MDRLSIFSKGETEVTIAEESSKVITQAVDGVADEVALLRKGHEAMEWEEEVREMEDVDLNDLKVESEQ